MSEAKWFLRTQDETFGPETREKLIEWAQLGRIQPGQEVSDDEILWQRVEEVPFLDMRFSIDIGDGNPRGPFNRRAAEALIASGRLPAIASIVETRAPFPVEAPVAPEAPVVEPVAEKVVEKVVEVEKPVEVIKEVVKEVRVEVPVEVEKIVEKIVEIEVPVEKIVEKVVEIEKPVEVIKEVIKEVPVEVEKIVVDETRIKELEAQREELKHRLEELTAKSIELNNVISGLSGKLVEAGERETKLNEQIVKLEDELRRLPQAASEVANIQAAMFSLMQGEAEGIATVIEAEKKEFEEFKKRHQERADKLMERRRAILKRTGADVAEMTRKALLACPEDPRTSQLRRDFEDLRRQRDQELLDRDTKIRELNSRLAAINAEYMRTSESMKDITQLRNEAQALREKLQLREKELVAERERGEALQKEQAVRQQTLAARLASLESPSFGTSSSMSTNQSREAKLVKLPSWMHLKK